MSKVSVIIPVYGVEKYIERCARSLFEQTLDDIEFLFIDDCTPDKSIDILKQILLEYPKRQSQVIIHRMNKNSGQAAVRNWGMQHVTGEFFIHCDSDDWVDSNMFRLLYEQAKRDYADISICDIIEENEERKRIFKGCKITDKWQLISDLCTMQIKWSACNKLVRTSLLCDSELQYPNGKMGEDMSVILQLILKAERISYVPQQLYHYYINPMSITHVQTEETMLHNYLQLSENVNIVLSAFAKYNLTNRYRKELEMLKWNVRRFIWDFTYMPKFKKLWKHTYPELFPSLLISPYLVFMDKVRFLLTYTSLYPRRNN